MKKILSIFMILFCGNTSDSMEIVPFTGAPEPACCISLTSDKMSYVNIMAAIPGGMFSGKYDFIPGKPFLAENIPGIEQIAVDADGRFLLDEKSLPGVWRIVTDFDVAVDSVFGCCLQIAAPGMTMRGESSVSELFLKITSLKANRAAMIEGTLLTRGMNIIGGKTVNRGVIKCDNTGSNGIVALKTGDMENDGQILGDCVLEAHAFLNNKKALIAGSFVEISANSLDNRGGMGNAESKLKFKIRDRMLSSGEITGAESEFIFHKQRTFLNDGILKIGRIAFTGVDTLLNNGFVSVSELSGSLKNVLDRGRGKSDIPDLSPAADTVENRRKSRPSKPTVENGGLIADCRDGYIINADSNSGKSGRFDRERIKNSADFCIFAENREKKLLFSLFRKGAEKFSRSLSERDFANFNDVTGDCFYLFARNGDIACHLFDGASGIWYDFSFDFRGDIELSLNEESSTGVEHGVEYAFHSGGSVVNRRPLAFFSLIIDSEALYNFSVLNVQKYLFRYMYRYNSGWLGLGGGYSSDIGVSAVCRDGIFVSPAAGKPAFEKCREDNYGITVGGSTACFGNGAVFNFNGAVLSDDMTFVGRGNTLAMRDAVCDISGALSGELYSFLIKNALPEVRSSVTVGRLSLSSPLKRLENDGVFLMREKSEIGAEYIFSTGLTAASDSATIKYRQMTGSGVVLGGHSLTLSKQISSSSFPDGVKFISPLIIQNEPGKSEKIFAQNESSVARFVADISRELGIAEKIREILRRRESEELQKISAKLKEYGTANRIVIDLKKAGLPSKTVERLLALPYFYAAVGADLQILSLQDGLSECFSREKDVKIMFETVILWKTNVEILKTKFGNDFEGYMTLWKQALGKRGEGVAIGLGLEKFTVFAEKTGVCRIAEAITEDVIERRIYSSAFDYLKRIISEDINGSETTGSLEK